MAHTSALWLWNNEKLEYDHRAWEFPAANTVQSVAVVGAHMKRLEHGLPFEGGSGMQIARVKQRASRRKSPGRPSLHLIGAACGVGAPEALCAQGPAQLRMQLASSPGLRGRYVWQRTLSSGAVKNPERFPPAGLGPFSRRLAKAVEESVAANARFVVLGGDHACALGTWNGAHQALRRKGPLGLIWIDAHMDAHTRDTSPSGRAHGMPLASLLGAGDPALEFFTGKKNGACLLPQHVCVVGVRSFEGEEEALLKRLGVRVYPMEEVARRGLVAVMTEAIERVGTDTAGFGVTLDVDAIDPGAAPAVFTPAPGGIRPEEIHAALRIAGGMSGFIGMEIAEFNPPQDKDGRTANLVQQVIETLADVSHSAGACELERRYLARNYEPLPVVLTRGKGVHVWDTAGRRYTDMMSAYSAVSFGHANARLLRAMAAQARRLSIVSRAYFTDRLGPLAERLCRLTGADRMLPMNTGAEAVETAVKAARKWAYKVKGVPEGRAVILACNGNFHGRTLTAVGMSTEAQYRDGFGPFAPGFLRIPYGDAAALEAAITDCTAAFLVEPIQGEGGIIVPPEGYLAACRKICSQHNVLLLCDEVQTGLGRTGRLLGCMHESVAPDGILLGKALGGGLYPVSAFLARAEVMDVFTPGDHGSTFGGNPLACAVALEALDILEEEHLVERAASMGVRMLDGLRALRSPLIRAVRGKGLFAGIELDISRASARQVCEAMLRHGILTKDTHHNVIRFAPPLVIDEAQMDDAIVRIGRALDEVMREIERA